MSSLLTWAFARPDARAALMTFTCATPLPKPSPANGWKPQHPQWWEFEVQGAIRAIRPPKPGSPWRVRLGWDAEGLAAVSAYREMDGPSVVHLEVGAIALRLRGKGGGYADEMLEDTLDTITARAFEAEVDEVLVTGHIYELNGPSQNLCRRAGFRHMGDTKRPGVQIWELELLFY